MTEMVREASAAPVVEAVIDLDCDLPPRFELAQVETAAIAAFRDRYPRFRRKLAREQPSLPPELEALQFLQDDERQLVQMRAVGFSFNRLAPYSSLDDYLPEVERAWRSFVALAAPLLVQKVRLRYLNRIVLPAPGGRANLDEYLKTGPRLPDEHRLTFLSFVHQHSVLEPSTGHVVNIVLTNEASANESVPIILDIAVSDRGVVCEPGDWPGILARVQSLRDLKNRVFRNTLTEQCLKLLRLPS